ncbi:hypothetical protein BSKO_12159 [Bryopsis sp. KO-2023]|nr:hypothetical protein BSKO_12159 [Bryopsis sp. KO-2023]
MVVLGNCRCRCFKAALSQRKRPLDQRAIPTLRKNRVSAPRCSRTHCTAMCSGWEIIEEEIPKQKKIKGYCYGCGVQVQLDEPGEIGFIQKEKYQTKAKFKQYGQLLCDRCVSLSHGKMVPAVFDLHQQAAGQPSKSLISPGEFRSTLMEVRDKAAVVVLLVDLLDLPGSFLNRVRDLIGGNPVVLIGTKFDLLPKKTSPGKVLQYLRDVADSRRLSVVSSHLISSRSGQGVSQAASSLLRNRRGRDVFVVGAANVGKSAFVNALLKEMQDFASVNFDLQAKSKSGFLPMESAMPGTTLGIIQVDAFSNGGNLYDTPGLHLFHRVPHLLSPEEMTKLQPRRRLRPYIAPSPLALTMQQSSSRMPNSEPSFEQFPEPEFVSGCYSWGSLARIEILEAPPSTEIVFYGPNALRVDAEALDVGLEETKPGEEEEEEQDIRNLWGDLFSENSETGDLDQATVSSKKEIPSSDWTQDLSDAFDQTVELEQQSKQPSTVATTRRPDSEPPETAALQEKLAFGERSIELRGGLALVREFEILASGVTVGVGDVSVSGLPGWCSILVKRGGGLVRGRIFVPRGVEAYLRPHIPVPDPESFRM